jgi:hypothetical protein
LVGVFYFAHLGYGVGKFDEDGVGVAAGEDDVDHVGALRDAHTSRVMFGAPGCPIVVAENPTFKERRLHLRFVGHPGTICPAITLSQWTIDDRGVEWRRKPERTSPAKYLCERPHCVISSTHSGRSISGGP